MDASRTAHPEDTMTAQTPPPARCTGCGTTDLDWIGNTGDGYSECCNEPISH